MIELYEPQKKAVEKQIEALTNYNAALCTANTGTGKTLMALETAKAMGLVPLICCPIAASATFRRWSDELSIPVLDIINIEKLRTGKTPYVSLSGSAKKGQFTWNLDRTKHLVIIDEAHRSITGSTSISGRMCCMLRPQGIKTLLLTATPPATPLGLRNIGYLCRLHQYSTSDFFNWCRRHGAVPSPFHRGLIFDVGTPKAKRAMEQINQALQPVLTKVTVEDLKDNFGENIVQTLYVNLSEDDTGRVQAIYDELSEELKKKNHDNPLVSQLRARQKTELLKIPALFDAVVDLLDEEYSVFVCLCFKESVRQLAEMLRGHAVNMITGDLGEAERTSAVALFQADMTRVLIATAEAGGASISLHNDREGQRKRTSLIVPHASASVFQQVLGRIYRAGGLTPALQRIVIAANTPEVKIAKRLEAKINLINTLTDQDLWVDTD